MMFIFVYMGKSKKPQPTKKTRSITYDKKLSINGTFEDVIKASFKNANTGKKEQK